MSRIINQNQNLIAKYLVDSDFQARSYDDVVPVIFDITLSKDGWSSQKTQIIENDLFEATDCLYTVDIISIEGRIQWIGSNMEFSAVRNGEAEFIYSSTNPTSDITIQVKKERISNQKSGKVSSIIAIGGDVNDIAGTYQSPIPFADVVSYLLEE